MYQAIIFDLDGLMVDTEKFYMQHFSEKFKQLNKEFTIEIFQGQMGLSVIDEANYMIEKSGVDMTTEEMIAFLGMKDMQKTIAQGAFEIEAMPGLFELINTFSKTLKYGIASGSPSEVIHYMVKTLGLTKEIPVMVSGEDVPKGKPSPDVYLEAAKQLGIDVKNCVVLEDAPMGVMAAKTAGAYTIAVPNIWTKEFDFQKADVICESLHDAIPVIKSLLK